MFSGLSGNSKGSVVRPAGKAGSWYEGDPNRLANYVSKLFDRVEKTTLNGDGATAPIKPVYGLIGPHAGLSYCGETSSHAYYLLRRWLYSEDAEARAVKRIFLLGPSHTKWIEGIEMTRTSAYETPFGNLQVDQDTIQDIKASCKAKRIACQAMDRATDEDEHSLELHLPFLSHVLHFPPMKDAKPYAGDVKIVPILVGGGAEDEVGHVLAPYFAQKENIFIVSSDFSHWGQRFRYTYHFEKSKYPNVGDSIEAMDRQGMSLISARDLKGWAGYLAETKNTICGRCPITSLMWAMEGAEKQQQHQQQAKQDGSLRTGPSAIEFLHYSQSSRCKSAQDSSVSYASAIFTSATQ